jgi:hypothetical protein
MDAPRKSLAWTALWVGAGIAVLVGLYALFGFRTVPELVREQARDFVQTNYGRELQLGDIRFDPFKLQLEIEDLLLPDRDGQLLLAFERLFVDFELSSLWQRAFVFREVSIEEPAVRAVIRPDGSMNLADLALPPDPEETSEDDSLPSIWLKLLGVDNGRLEFEDQSRAPAYADLYDPITFSLQDFRTTPEGGDFVLSAVGEHGGEVEWTGEFALAPQVSSIGEFKLAGPIVPHIGELLGDALPFLLTSGELKLSANYSLQLGGTTDLEVHLPAISLAGVGLRARGVDEDWVSIPSIEVADTKLSIPENTLTINRVTVQGLTAKAWLDENGELSIDRLLAPPTPAASGTDASAPTDDGAAPGPAEPAPAATVDSGTQADPDWSLQLASLEVNEAAIQLEDRYIAPVTPFTFAPLRMKLSDLSLDLTQPLPFELDATVNEHVPLRLAGTVTPEPLATDLAVTLSGARMQILQPYVLPLADVTIRGGQLDLDGRFAMLPPEADGSEISFDGDVTVQGFKSTDNVLDEDFVNWERLELRKLRYAMAPDSLSMDSVLLQKPYARVVLSQDQVLNIAAALDPEGTAAASREREAAAEAAAREAERMQDPAYRKARQREEKERTKAAKAAGAKPGPQPANAAPLAESGMPIRVREVRIRDGQMNYSDYFIQPNFSADIRRLNGTIRGLSSDPNSRARIDLEGRLGEFSPVSIQGESQPFAFDRYTDIQMRFADIPLPVLNPYSGTFAGFNIAKGMLTTELDYHIENRALDAQHHVVIDGLTWGEATGSKKAVSLPIRLATSLLKDANGVIDLELPVSGTLDDPEFRIGPIVWQIVKNLIVKVVSAPFKFLGSLFQGAEEAKFVDFAPGDATLAPQSAQNLQALAQALAQKPELKLDVPMGGIAELDTPALLQRRYEQELAAELETAGQGGADADASATLATLDSKAQAEVLSALVTRLSGSAPTLPEAPPRPEGMSRKEAKAAARAAEIEYLQQQAHAAVRVNDSDLDALGQARAEAIRAALLTDTTIDPGRIFPDKAGKITAQDGQVRFELEID